METVPNSSQKGEESVILRQKEDKKNYEMRAAFYKSGSAHSCDICKNVTKVKKNVKSYVCDECFLKIEQGTLCVKCGWHWIWVITVHGCYCEDCYKKQKLERQNKK